MSVQDWTDAMNRAVHAPIFVSPTKALEPIVEKQTAEEFAKALGEEFDVHLDEVRNCDEPNHSFPDCLARSADGEVGIELTELVRGEFRGKTDIRWGLKQWNLDQFERGLSELATKKANSSRKHGVVLDYLVIHSNEEWISPGHAQSWLTEFSIDAENRFREAYFLQFYVPGWREHWPLHKIALNNPA